MTRFAFAIAALACLLTEPVHAGWPHQKTTCVRITPYSVYPAASGSGRRLPGQWWNEGGIYSSAPANVSYAPVNNSHKPWSLIPGDGYVGASVSRNKDYSVTPAPAPVHATPVYEEPALPAYQPTPQPIQQTFPQPVETFQQPVYPRSSVPHYPTPSPYRVHEGFLPNHAPPVPPSPDPMFQDPSPMKQRPGVGSGSKNIGSGSKKMGSGTKNSGSGSKNMGSGSKNMGDGTKAGDKGSGTKQSDKERDEIDKILDELLAPRKGEDPIKPGRGTRAPNTIDPATTDSANPPTLPPPTPASAGPGHYGLFISALLLLALSGHYVRQTWPE